MFLQAISAVSMPSSRGSSNLVFLQDLTNPNAISTVPSPCLNPFTSSLSPSSPSLSLAKTRDKGFATSATNETASLPLTGLVFQPFEEVKKDEFMVPMAPLDSFARQRYSKECENAINEQINGPSTQKGIMTFEKLDKFKNLRPAGHLGVEYSVSYVYHSLYAYFDRDNVALKGLAKFFKESSEEEREHAEKLMKYQSKRGGKVILYHIKLPPTDFDHIEKGDALYAMELALSLEKLTNEKLLKVHGVAYENNDPQMTDFIESEFLGEQVEAIKKIAEYVAQLRRVGKGHGVWHFDQMLLH